MFLIVSKLRLANCWELGGYHCRRVRTGKGGASSFSDKVLCCGIHVQVSLIFLIPLKDQVTYLPVLALCFLGVGPAQRSWEEPRNKPHVFLWRRQQRPLVVMCLVFCRNFKSCLGVQWKICHFNGVKVSKRVEELLH